MRNQSSKFNSIPMLFIIAILSAVLVIQFGAIQTVAAQTDCVDPFTGAQCTPTSPGPTCGLPGLPPCNNPPPADTATAVIIYPTRTPLPSATSTPTATATATPTATLVPTRPPVPTHTPVTPSPIPSITPTVVPSAVPTPKPGFIPQLVLKLPPPPPFMIAMAPHPNFEAFKVEITQAIQCINNPNCPDNSVQLFVGKPTMIRLYVRIAPGSPFMSVSGIGGELCPGIHNEQGCSNPIHSINYITVTKLKSTADVSLFRGNINSTLNFILPSGWTYGNITAYVNLKGEDYLLEPTFKDNFVSQSFQENASQRLDVMFVSVKSRGYLADFNERFNIRDWLTLRLSHFEHPDLADVWLHEQHT